jgi:ribosomal protein S6--L-glutamate ligase
MDALAAVADAGVAVINPPKAIEVSVDKYLATRLLAQAGLAVPATIACEKADDALAAFEALGRDVVVKPLFGSEGRGLFRVNDADLAFRTFKTLEQLGAVAYVQQFIEHDGSDYRALVMGNSVVAATRRTSADGWRTNVARGGKAEAVELAAEQQATAVRAARACGCLVAGVDLLPGVDGRWWVLEVNAVPGWRAMAPATGLDIAAMMIDFAAEAAW